MCIAVPAKIVNISYSTAEVETLGVLKQVSVELVPEAGTGDFVLIHAGFAIQLVDEENALQTLELFKEIMEHGDS